MYRHSAEQVPRLTKKSVLQDFGAQDVGHALGSAGGNAMSHLSPIEKLMARSPQTGEQSGSFSMVQPGAQHPSAVGEHSVTSVTTQWAVQSSGLPTTCA